MKNKRTLQAVILNFIFILVVAFTVACNGGMEEDPTAVGEHITPDATDILAKWETITSGDCTEVFKISIGTYTVRPLYSSTSDVIEPVTINDRQEIESIINILAEDNADFELIPSEESMSYHDACIGKRVITLTFCEADDKEIMHIDVYEDNNADIGKTASIEQDTVSIFSDYKMKSSFKKDVFNQLIEMYNNKK